MKAKRDVNDWGLTDSDFAVVGRIAVAHARIDIGIDRLILQLSRLSDADAAAFLSGALFSAKLRVLEDLLSVRLRSRARRLASLKQLVSHLKHLNGERTVAIHGIWGSFVPLRELAKGSETSGVVQSVMFNHDGTKRVLRLQRAHAVPQELLNTFEELAALIHKTWPKQVMTRSDLKMFRQLQKQMKQVPDVTSLNLQVSPVVTERPRS